ncbi:hypothetical protein AB0C12_15225 [Actinoplanes sp. NPDC048967]|uniref:hypothetical protein n=1 Tax=Actinoplanes sp. NPDC048967 TaxID=3155269 RepID=UPI0033DF7886
MRPGPWLLTAAAGLGVVHVIGVLSARPLYRPAEVLATLCLLAYAIRDDLRAYAIRDDLLADRGPARWGSSVAAAVLVAGAALTVPPPAGDGSGLRFLSSEQYDDLIRRTQLESLIPVTAALLFVLVLLTTTGQGRRPSRIPLMTGIVAAVLLVGYTVVRLAVICSGPRETPGAKETQNLSPAVMALIPLLVALTALALAVVAATQRRLRAAGGALLLTLTGLIWIDAAIGAALLPYAVHEDASMLSLDLFTATDALPQPTQALTAALQLTAAVLLIAGPARRPSAARV